MNSIWAKDPQALAARMVQIGTERFISFSADVSNADTRYSYIGERAQLSTQMQDSLEAAKAMAANGKTSEQIRSITGWVPGKYDGKMRWEVPDHQAQLNKEITLEFARAERSGVRLGDWLSHESLFEAYPEAYDLMVEQDDAMEGGAYADNTITFGYKKVKDLKSLLLHEIQHWIQEKEGFAKGSNPQSFTDYSLAALKSENEKYAQEMKRLVSEYKTQGKTPKEARDSDYGKTLSESLIKLQDEIHKSEKSYRRTAGEIESRDVQARQSFTLEQRKAIAPYSNENIAAEDAIVLFGRGGEAASQSIPSSQVTPAEEARALEMAEGVYEELAPEAQELLRRVAEFQLERVLREWRGKPGFMLAPNGKPTKLNERQWAQVRTPLFKRFFGDWEGALYKDFLKGEPVKNLTGAEFAKGDKDFISQAKEFFLSVGGEATNPMIGKVSLGEEGIKTSISPAHKLYRNKAIAFAAIPEIIKNGVVVDSKQNWKERGWDSAVISAPITINGEPFAAFVVVKTKGDGSNDFYLEEVFQIKTLDDMANKTLSKQGTISPSVINIAYNIFSVNPENVSKVIDENGEPMVVYHGTNAEFDKFKTSEGMYGDGIYLAKDPEYASGFADEVGGNVKPLFARITGETDGKILPDKRGGIYVASSPNQIKSAIANNGAFTNSGNIAFSSPVVAEKQDDTEKRMRFMLDWAKMADQIFDKGYNTPEKFTQMLVMRFGDRMTAKTAMTIWGLSSKTEVEDGTKWNEILANAKAKASVLKGTAKTVAVKGETQPTTEGEKLEAKPEQAEVIPTTGKRGDVYIGINKYGDPVFRAGKGARAFLRNRGWG